MRGKGREHFGGLGQRRIYSYFHINHLLSFSLSLSIMFLPGEEIISVTYLE